jgi:hypothetical protein
MLQCNRCGKPLFHNGVITVHERECLFERHFPCSCRELTACLCPSVMLDDLLPGEVKIEVESIETILGSESLLVEEDLIPLIELSDV